MKKDKAAPILNDIDVHIDTKNKVITLHVEMDSITLYSWLKELWRESPHYIMFTFPLESHVDAFGTYYFNTIHGWVINSNLQKNIR